MLAPYKYPRREQGTKWTSLGRARLWLRWAGLWADARLLSTKGFRHNMFSSSKKPKWNADKCKVNLKMLVNRFQLLTQKKANLAKQQKRQVALLLRDDKEANARILVEHIIREDYTLESYTEQLIARFNVLVTEADLRPEIGEAVNSILYSGWLMGSDVPELKELNMLFTAKYGVPYAEEVVANKENYLNQRLLRMLTSTQVPDPTVIELYLTEIAKAYSVEWKPRPAETVMHVSSTIGVPVPLPGMPVANEQTPPQLIPPLGPTPVENPVYATAVPVPTASSSHHAPTTSVPPSVPPAMINFDTLMPSPDAAEEYTASMLMGPQGFGMALDSDNVVLTVRPDSEAARCGLVQARGPSSACTLASVACGCGRGGIL
eukprot:6190572-Pleurochrysis_carterae.AAC.1